MQETSQKTEKFLWGALSILLLVLVFNFYNNNTSPVEVASAESQDGGGDEGNSSDEDSGDSANSEDEASEPSTASTPSVQSAPSTTTQARKTTTATEAASEKSTSQAGLSVASVNDDTGQLSVESVKSLNSEDSSIETVSTEGNVSLVKREGKLFFLIPVEIESEITTNDTGTVIAEKRNFLNWLKDVFSF